MSSNMVELRSSFRFPSQRFGKNWTHVHIRNQSIVLTTMETINSGRDQVVRLIVACGLLATVAVFLRFVARRRSKASFAADDWWMVASLIPSYCMLAVGLICSSFDLALSFHADESSDHEWKSWPAC